MDYKLNQDRSLSVTAYLERHPYQTALAWFTVLTLVFFSGSLTGDFMFRDAFHEYLPLRMLWGWAKIGRFALWNPHSALGVPLSGAVYPGLFYPLNDLLFWALRMPADLGCKIFILVHYPIAGAGMVYMLRETGIRRASAYTGAVAYAFSGFFVSQHYAVNMLAGVAFLPWAVGMVMRGRCEARLRWYAWGGALNGLIFLGGDPQGFALALICSVLAGTVISPEPTHSTASRPAGTALILLGPVLYAVFAVAAASAELLPSLAVLGQSQRGAGFGLDIASCWSFHPLRTIEFLLVRPFGDPWPIDRYWGGFMGENCFPLPMVISPYLGIWSAIAVVASWRGLRSIGDRAVLFFTALMLFFLVMSMGGHTPLFKLLFRLVPGMDALRFPEKYLLMVTFSAAVLTGIGTDGLVPRPDKACRYSKGYGASLVLPTLALVAALAVWMTCRACEGRIAALIAPLLGPNTPEVVTPAMAAEDLIGSVVRSGVLLFIGLLVLEALGRPYNRWMAYAPTVFLFLDLWQGNAFLAPASPGLYRMESRMATEILKREGKPPCETPGRAGRIELPCCSGSDFHFCAGEPVYRIFRDPYIPSPPRLTYEQTRRWERDTLKPNLGVIEGFEDFMGLNVASSANYRYVMGELVEFNLLPLYNVKYAIVSEDKDPKEYGKADTLFDYRGARLAEFRNIFPRAYWIEQARPAMDHKSLAALFAENNFSYAVVIEPNHVLGESEADASMFVEGSGHGGIVPAVVSYDGPNIARVKVNAPLNGWLVLNDGWFPGWTAEVDGKPAPIYRANGLVRAVRIKRGAHEADFRFRPELLSLGLALSLAAFVLAVVIGIAERR